MSEKQDREKQKATFERMYVEGNVKVKELARVMGVSQKQFILG